jgi:hypothetical protein
MTKTAGVSLRIDTARFIVGSFVRGEVDCFPGKVSDTIRPEKGGAFDVASKAKILPQRRFEVVKDTLIGCELIKVSRRQRLFNAGLLVGTVLIGHH